MSELLKKKGIRSQGPSTCFKNKMEHLLKKIGLILNNKISEWINMRSTISRYLPSVEHQLT